MLLGSASAPHIELRAHSTIQSFSPRWLRLSVGAIVVVLAVLNLVTLVAEPMPAHHYVAVPIATGLMVIVWAAELVGLRWSRPIFTLAAVGPNIWLALIGHATANLLLLMPVIGWVTYTGGRWQSIGALAFSLATIGIAVLADAADGQVGVAAWTSWTVGLFAIWLLAQLIVRQERLLTELRRLRAESEHRVRELELLNEQIQRMTALEERQRLARELHDSVSQALYGIALGARTARTLLDRDPLKAVQPVEYVLSLAEAGIAEMRALIFELRPESLEQEGLAAALAKQADALRARYGIAVETTLADEPDLPLSFKEAFYRIAQEAMHNTVKHAQAKHVTLRLITEDCSVVLEVSDDGIGFDPTAGFPGHLGLKSMCERMERLGGTLAIESAPGAGTRVRSSVTVQSPSLPSPTGAIA
jgi:signal transduction histidine kinase